MFENLAELLDQKCHASPGQMLIVAVSGGPDSLCLLHLLKNLNYRLVAAHLDHQIRSESSADAQTVRNILEDWDIEHVIEQVDVPAYARLNKLSIEEAARDLRYEFLFQQAKRFGAEAVATAHTADDQVETILMHLLRGAGLAGLRGMPFYSLPNPWSQEIPLIRPVLGAWRAEITEYLLTHGLSPLADPSNLDRKYYRNRIRLDLVPILESYNPQARQRIWQTAQVLSQDYDLLTDVLDAAWAECAAMESNTQVSFMFSSLQDQPPAVQRHLLKRAAHRLLPGLRDLDYAALERGRAFIESPPRTRQVDWIAGLRLWLEADRLWLGGWQSVQTGAERQPAPLLSTEIILRLPIPGSLDLQTGWRIEAEVAADLQAARLAASQNQEPFQAWLDSDRITAGLSVRTRRPGDRIRPLGMAGHSVKLSDLMINAKVPGWARAGWPLVLVGDEIAWAPGLRLAESYRLADASRSAIFLKIYPV